MILNDNTSYQDSQFLYSDKDNNSYNNTKSLNSNTSFLQKIPKLELHAHLNGVFGKI